MRLTVTRLCAIVGFLLLPVLAPPLLAQRAETIRGRVTSDSGRVVANATVFITRGPDRLLQQALTTEDGRYTITFAEGTGDYLIAVQATGFRPARRRVTRVAEEREFVADFVLSPVVATTLDAVQVNASRPVRARRTIDIGQDPGAVERMNEGVVAGAPPNVAGDIATTVSTMPGMTLGPDGISMLGASSSSNLTTLNGMALGAGSLPKVARVTTRATGATFDATRGGFSGANIDVRLSPGDRDFQNRVVSGTLDSPNLQYSDAVGRALGATNNFWRFSAGADGEAVRSALTYNVTIDASRSARALNDITNGSALAYAQSGVAADSIARARSVARAVGLPLRTAGLSNNRQRDAVSVLTRFDDTRDTLKARSLTGYLNQSSSDNEGVSVLAAPNAGVTRGDRAAGMILSLGAWSGVGLSTMRTNTLNASLTSQRTTPNADGPAVDVLVRTTGDATAAANGITSLSLGSRGVATQQVDRWLVEGTHEYLRNARGSRHTIRGIVWGRVDGLAQNAATSLGRYSFASMADLAADQPSSYSRTLVVPDRRGRAWNAVTALSHTWNKSRYFSMIYGARLEANGFFTAPAENPALASSLGVRTGAITPRLHVSPRIGFTWALTKQRLDGIGSQNSMYGLWYRYPTGVLRGGIGEFRDLWRPDAIADAAARTGLAGSTVSLTCVGRAVPLVAFDGSGDLPTQCLGGGGALTERAPSVTVLDPRYNAPRSWRATLDYNTTRWKMVFRATALGSLDFNQASVIDRNFSGTPRFTLAAEGNRPVYVSPAAIDAASGVVSAAESRTRNEYGRVNVLTSDLRGRGGQLTFTAGMDRFDRRWRGWPFMLATYTAQRVDRQVRGFDAAALGDPRRVEWAPSFADARHTWLLHFGHDGKFGSISAYARLQSGLPFTPVVQGDINGDGRSGDRAWVPTMSSITDVTLASGVRALESSGSATARQCLRVSQEKPGERNSCRGPWTRTLSASFSPPINRGPNSRWNRVAMKLFAENLLGGLDQLVHGAAGMRGWGGVSAPDPVLLVPRGFDASANAFRYDVNPRFAETRPSRLGWRDPFRLTLDVTVRLSTDYDRQTLGRAIEPVKVNGTWARRSVDSIAAQYLRRTSSIHRILVSEGDTLLLTSSQVTQLQQLDSAYSAQVRDLYRGLAEYLTSLPAAAPSKAAVDSSKQVTATYWTIFWKQPELAAAVLNPQQIGVISLLQDMLTVPQAQRPGQQYRFGWSVPLVHRTQQVRKEAGR